MEGPWCALIWPAAWFDSTTLLFGGDGEDYAPASHANTNEYAWCNYDAKHKVNP